MNQDMIRDGASKVITVGKVKLTLFSFITVLCGLTIGLVATIRYHFVIGLIITGGFFLAAYNINCVLIGKCYAWAWALGIFYVVYTMILLATSFGFGNRFRVL